MESCCPTWRSGNLASDSHARPVGDLDTQQSVPGKVLLAWTATRPLARNNRATLEDLSTPDTPGLGPLDRACEALDLQRAAPAEGLRNLEVSRYIGEPQIRVVLAARQLRVHPDSEHVPAKRSRVAVGRSERQSHPSSPSSLVRW